MLRAQAEQKRQQGDQLGALAHMIAAQSVEAHNNGTSTSAAMDLCKIATGYFMMGEDKSAERWYRLALTLDPNAAVAYQNLAAICARTGRTVESESYRDRAYSLQRVFIESPSDPIRRLLILHAGRTSGNVPFDTLLSTGTSSRIRYAIDFAAVEEDSQLPPFDLVFNAIGDSDVAAPLADRLEYFVNACAKPLLNPPARVARTSRDRLPALLGNLKDVVVAPCVRCQGPFMSLTTLRGILANAGIDWPVLVRPAASHGGDRLKRCENIEALAETLRSSEEVHYLTAFCDSRGVDGHYRKYRVIFIDREPFPYHLAISSHWMVHYFSADMTASPGKIEEDRRFLQDSGAALGSRASAAVAAIGRRLDMDYGGIDFAVLQDGRVLVFEANATMLVHRERHNGPLAHKNPHVQRIVDAFEQLLVRRTAHPGVLNLD
jgi:tetratricopeptide (TPR) repeat protein